MALAPSYSKNRVARLLFVIVDCNNVITLYYIIIPVSKAATDFFDRIPPPRPGEPMAKPSDIGGQEGPVAPGSRHGRRCLSSKKAATPPGEARSAK